MPLQIHVRRLCAVLCLVLLALPIVSCGNSRPGSAERPRAIILMVGDGFGFSQVAFARNMLHGEGGRLALESLPTVGFVATHSASNAVTDSGAAATAFASGIKTDNQVVGVTPDGEPLTSIADRAQEAGWKIGYVTSTSLTHATPAAFYASVRDRYADVDSIAAQLLEQAPDLALGGGKADFLPLEEQGRRRDGRNLLVEAEAAGYSIVTYDDAFEALPDGKVLGLLAGGHLPYLLDNRQLPEALHAPRLAQLTERALEHLSRDGEPFFLLVEGGRIDHAGHSFDAHGVAVETGDFDDAYAVVRDFQKEHPDTLILITADHATGGLAINDYIDWDLVKEQQASLEWISTGLRDLEDPMSLDEARRLSGIQDLTEAEIALVRETGDSYEATRVLGRFLADRHGVTWIPRINPLDTKGHTGEDVPIYAGGPGAERFGGSLDNTEIPLRLAELMGWPAPGV